MAGEPLKTGQLDPASFKANLQIVVSDPDIPEGPGKQSLRIDAGDIRPKTIDWDVTSNEIPAIAVDGDYLKVTVAGTYNGDIFGVNGLALVTNKALGIVTPVNTALGGYAVLQAFNITSVYPEATAEGETYTRTAFTSGDVVNFSFTASEPINKIAIWPFDATIVEGLPTGTPVIVNVSGENGTGSFTIPAAIGGASAFVNAGRLYVAARAYGDYTDVIQTTDTFNFDNRVPDLVLSDVVYPVGQTAIKLAEEATIEVAIANTLAKYLKGAAVAGEQLIPVSPLPTNGVIDVTGLNVFSFTVARNSVEFDTANGLIELELRAYNAANNKYRTITVPVFVESAIFTPPAIVVNGGQPVVTAVGGKEALVAISSDVRLSNPTGLISFANANVSAWETIDDGYTWNASIFVNDNATRVNNAITGAGFTTAAGSAVPITDNYTVSGFEERAVSFDGIFSPYATLVDVTIDHLPNVTVRNIVGGVINPLLYSYDNINNRLVFDPIISDLNSTGTLYVLVSQTPNV